MLVKLLFVYCYVIWNGGNWYLYKFCCDCYVIIWLCYKVIIVIYWGSLKSEVIVYLINIFFGGFFEGKVWLFGVK